MAEEIVRSTLCEVFTADYFFPEKGLRNNAYSWANKNGVCNFV